MSYHPVGATVTVKHRDEKGKLVLKSAPATGPRDARGGGAVPTPPVPEGGGMSKMVLFAGLGAAALIAVVVFKKKGKKSEAPSIALFSAPKVA